MSRTIRRIRDKRRNDSGRSHFEELFTWEWTDNGLASHKVKLEGQAYDKAWWRFHGDRIKGGWSYSASLREMFESTCRAKINWK